ncbi:MAG: DinB family protein [Deltaproteobacteria bacterium]|nr:DinB family protein [Deltaproteobacteria bacterium]
MLDYFNTLARYNRWAHDKLLAACEKLPHAEYHQTRPAFFHSIHGTLNHILVADRVWLGRIEGVDPGIRSLDQELYPDFSTLRAARQAENERIIRVVAGLTAERMAGRLTYTTQAGNPQQTPLSLVLGHLFNHATHHRGQVHDQLSQTPVPPPSMDLIYYLREA